MINLITKSDMSLNKKLTQEQFELCIDFHANQIRTRLGEDTIENARRSLVVGDVDLPGIGSKKRFSANKLVRKVLYVFGNLSAWPSLSWDEKVALYIRGRKKTPKPAVFDAVKSMRDNGRTYCQASFDQAEFGVKVNPQSVKVLLPRLKRWDDYSDLLSKAK